MGRRFLSQEWLDEGRKRLEKSPEFAKAIGKLDATVLTQVEEAPSGTVYSYHEFAGGKVRAMETGPGAAKKGEGAAFKIRGSYETFRRLQDGSLTVQGAYLRRLVKLEGDKGAFLRFAPAFMAYNKVMRDVETDY